MTWPLRTTLSSRASAVFLPSASNRGARKTTSSVCHSPNGRAAFDSGRNAFIEVVILRQQLGAGIDAAAMAGGRLGDAVAVEDLDLVEALELDARVRSLGDHELEVRLDVAEFRLAEQVPRPAALAVEDDPAARERDQSLGILGVGLRIAGLVPGGRGRAPGVEGMFADQGDPAFVAAGRGRGSRSPPTRRGRAISGSWRGPWMTTACSRRRW